MWEQSVPRRKEKGEYGGVNGTRGGGDKKGIDDGSGGGSGVNDVGAGGNGGGDGGNGSGGDGGGGGDGVDVGCEKMMNRKKRFVLTLVFALVVSLPFPFSLHAYYCIYIL